MFTKEAADAYDKALKEGQREYRECLQKKISPHPAVLDEILAEADAVSTANTIKVGLVDIPTHRIVGTKSAGRISAFSPSFRPLLDPDSEFAIKWISLCSDHLGDEGIHDPIECFEYLGNFYVQEGNKRVSVLRHFEATRIAANVKRIMPAAGDSPQLKAYYEFLEFYKLTGLYDVQFTTPGSYTKLLERLGFPPGQVWTEEDRRSFRAGLYHFTHILASVGGDVLPQPEDALLLWLEVHSFTELKNMPVPELKKTITRLWPNLLAASDPEPVVKTEPPEEKGVIAQLLRGAEHLNVAFVHQYTAESSPWTRAHESGRLHLEEVLGSSVATWAYFEANTPERAERLIEQAVADGAEVVFTTAPQLISPCMKASVAYPKVRFLNCSVQQPYASVRTYYSRIYEAKFITGAIAGAMCKDDRIGYVGSYPIHGVPASINAFALGAQMTNPKAKIELKWSCLPGNPTQELLEQGIRVISNRDTPTESHLVNEYGTYLADDWGALTPLGSPVWVWGQFYENVIRSMMNGSWEDKKDGQVVNLWWGMSSGVIDVRLADDLPEGIRVLADLLKRDICSGTLDPFGRRIVEQNGTVRNDGTVAFTPLEVLKMDWLCENIIGDFPKFDEILPISRSMVALLGIDPSTEKVVDHEAPGRS